MALFLLWDRCKEEVRAAAIVSLSLGISSGPQQSNWTHVIHLGNNDDEENRSHRTRNHSFFCCPGQLNE